MHRDRQSRDRYTFSRYLYQRPKRKVPPELIIPVRGIIHGDLKPENVLIFSDLAGTYSAKVIDFGYSTQYADDEHLIGMPISWPWSAPEHTRLDQRWTPAEARQLDAFSFGLLCLWVLFEKTLSGATALFDDTAWACPNDEQSTFILAKYKDAQQLPVLVQRLLDAGDSMRDDEKHAAGSFFNSILSREPLERDISSIGDLSNLSDRPRYHSILRFYFRAYNNIFQDAKICASNWAIGAGCR